jgi:hypothetical protein
MDKLHEEHGLDRPVGYTWLIKHYELSTFTVAIKSLLTLDFIFRLQAFSKQVDPALFQRAIDYLYFKESRSSYNI